MRKPILALLLGFPENAVIIRAVRQENMAYVEKRLHRLSVMLCLL